MKVCSKCKEAKCLAAFRTRVRNGSETYRSQCKACESKAQMERARHNLVLKEKSLKRLVQWGKDNKERRQEAASERRLQRYKEDSEYRAKVKSQSSEYRARKLNATLSDKYSEEILAIYKDCPNGYEVDHIVPLKGENICGLHVPWNLQYLTPTENRSKNNAFDPSDAFAPVGG